MARNRERLGAHSPDPTPPASMMQDDNSGGFSFVIPSEFVELPSRGKYYPEGHPLHAAETIEIKHMTAKEEDLLTSRALLKKGIVLDRLLDSLIKDKRIKAEHLLIGDRNAILVAARISGYGPEYSTTVTCPACGTNQEYNFDLHDIEAYSGDGVRDEDAVLNENGTYTTKLPRTGIEVTFRLLNGVDERQYIRQLEDARKARKEENAVTRQLRQIIVSVNGETSRQAIDYVVDNVPSLDARHIRQVYNLANPDLDMRQHFACNSCDHEQELEVPLTADFFWPDR